MRLGTNNYYKKWQPGTPNYRLPSLEIQLFNNDAFEINNEGAMASKKRRETKGFKFNFP